MMLTKEQTSLIKFGTKADTLTELSKHHLSSTIPIFKTYTYAHWVQDSEAMLKNIFDNFTSNHVAVRSSAACEDGLTQSNAGAFLSILDINPENHDQLKEAIEKVFASYPEKNEKDQVLIQQMVEGITVSGVILTRYIDDGSPYYVLNYDDESGRSDSVTGGTGVHKTVMVYRKYKPEYCDSNRVRKMLALAQEVEELCGWIPLDIEFAMDHAENIYLLQVRRISTVGGWHPDTEHRVSRIIPHVESFVEQLSARKKGLYGNYTILGNMPDWNPAELIGPVPSPLAASLFRKLISSHNWSLARTQMGYRELPKTELMLLINGRPFIDVRASFNSFLPAGLPEDIGEKLINAWLDRLASKPSLHDKVEFDVAQTVYDFSFEDIYNERYANVLDAREKQIFTDKLKYFTNQALDLGPNGSLPKALATIDKLADYQDKGGLYFESESPVSLAAHIANLLDECIRYGTIPFNMIARHAFIAESMLRSAVKREAISPERVAEFKSSFSTIMGDLAADTIKVTQGQLDQDKFNQRYGHLRPGTFDIMSPCYRDRPDLFTNCSVPIQEKGSLTFDLDTIEEQNINCLLDEAGIETVDAHFLFEYARKAIQGREYAKFVFTRNLSKAIEAIAVWGELFNLGREDLSFLRLEDILDTCYASTRSEMTSLLMQKVDHARIEQSFASVLKLSYLIRGVRDIHVVPVHRSEPNFITQKRVERPCKMLEASALNYGTLKDQIICIDNADPGFDWIFTKGIAGLITKYGGANSHMAIRCAELSLPAAIGCGEDLFERLRNSQKIELDCATKTIRPLNTYE